MAKRNAPQAPHLNFARLDDEDRDYDAPSVSDQGRGVGGGRILDWNVDDDTIISWQWPIGLALVWFLVLLIEMVFFDTDAKGLAKLPVVLGQPGSLSILKPMTMGVAKIAAAHRFLGALLFIFDRLLIFVAMAICSICAGFMHASLGHWFGNVILLIILSLCAWLVHYPLSKLIRNWLILSATGIGFTWLVVEFMSFFVQGHHNTLSWLYEIGHSTEPIVGASVGLYGLVSFMLVICLKQIRQARWVSLLAIFLVVVSLALLYMRFSTLHGLQVYTNVGAALKLAVVMHFIGYLIGIFRGLHDQTVIN